MLAGVSQEVCPEGVIENQRSYSPLPGFFYKELNVKKNLGG